MCVPSPESFVFDHRVRPLQSLVMNDLGEFCVSETNRTESITYPRSNTVTHTDLRGHVSRATNSGSNYESTRLGSGRVVVWCKGSDWFLCCFRSSSIEPPRRERRRELHRFAHRCSAKHFGMRHCCCPMRHCCCPFFSLPFSYCTMQV